MRIERIDERLCVCRLKEIPELPSFFALTRTDEELSYVCFEKDIPAEVLSCEYGWRAMRVAGTLDFSLVGILANITGTLAAEKIGLFAVSTYNTDYILVKEENYEDALRALAASGWDVEDTVW